MMIIAADSLEAAPLIVDNELARRDHSVLLVRFVCFLNHICVCMYLFTHSVHMYMHYEYLHTLWAHIYVCVCVCVKVKSNQNRKKVALKVGADVVELAFSPTLP